MLNSQCRVGRRVRDALPADVEIRAGTKADALALGPILRDADRAELEAATGRPATDVAVQSVELSTKCWVATEAGVPMVLFGVAPLAHFNGVGVPWLIASPALIPHAVPFLRRCSPFLDEMHADYPLLVNYTDARNTVHHRWLRWLGFTFIHRHERFGAAGIPFIEFVRIANDLQQGRCV